MQAGPQTFLGKLHLLDVPQHDNWRDHISLIQCSMIMGNCVFSVFHVQKPCRFPLPAYCLSCPLDLTLHSILCPPLLKPQQDVLFP